jgi:two-component system, LytTR family, sensor kinase
MPRERIKRSKWNKNSGYWISQGTGWGLYAIINGIIAATFDTFTFPRLLILLYFCFAGFSLTHLYRGVIKKNNWFDLPLRKAIPRVLISSILIGILLYLLLFTISWLSGVLKIEEIKPASPLLGIFNSSSIILIWSLIYFAVHYFQNYKRAEIESLIWEAAVKDFELKTLKSQLNPHFMFNALNSIRALIEEDPENAKTAITQLSAILRYSLKIERSETVPLGEEIQTVKDYLALEKIRFEERLRYTLEVDPLTEKIEIPPMMIQTLVENGIKHGISKKMEGGDILVSTKVIDEMLKITIINTGQFDSTALQHSKGFGISNTKHRLNLLYGEKASFTIFNNPNEKVSAEITLPTGGSIR